MNPILLAPDKFKGSLDAAAVAEALAAGIGDADPGREVRRCPVADGGEGTVAAALAAGWAPVVVTATGPTGAPLTATYARRGPTALVELAAVAGLAVLPGDPDPAGAGTEGLGAVLAHALDAGASEIVIGLGGSATTDGGAGILRGLGARIRDAAGRDLPPGGKALSRAHHLDLTHLHPRLRRCGASTRQGVHADGVMAPQRGDGGGVRVVLAADVDNPLLGVDGAAAVYGPQKGATPSLVAELDVALRRWVSVLGAAAGVDPAALASAPGAGAAGGAGLGLTALCGAERRPGVGTVLELTGFADALAVAALVVTGEGRLDRQTLHGKAPAGVAAAGRAAGVPVVAVAGECALSAAEIGSAGFAAAHSLVDLAGSRDAAVAGAGPLLRRVGARIAADTTPGRPVSGRRGTGSAPGRGFSPLPGG